MFLAHNGARFVVAIGILAWALTHTISVHLGVGIDLALSIVAGFGLATIAFDLSYGVGVYPRWLYVPACLLTYAIMALTVAMPSQPPLTRCAASAVLLAAAIDFLLDARRQRRGKREQARP